MNGIIMTTSARVGLTVAEFALNPARVAAIVALALGTLLIFGVGFAQPDIIHTVAHDGRHAFSLPCH